MGKQSKTEIKLMPIIIALVCFVNMYWAFSGKWGLRDKEAPEPVLGVICLIAGVVFLYAAFSDNSQ